MKKNIYNFLRAAWCGLVLVIVIYLSSCGTVQPRTPFSIDASWLAPGFDTNGWPTLGYDAAHSGVFPAMSRALSGHVVWHRNVGGPIFSAPVLSDGVVYVGSTSGNLLAFNAQTGTLLWHQPIGQFLNDATPVVVGRVIFVGENRTQVSALDATTGHQLWTIDTHEIIKAAPTYADGLVLINAGTTTFALDAQTGMTRWHFHESGSGWPTTATPTVQGQMVYVAQGTSTVLYALNLLTGRKLWSYNVGDRLISTPIVVGQTLVLGTWMGTIAGLDASSGTLLWTYNVNRLFKHGGSQDGIAGSPASGAGLIFFGTFSGHVLALDARSGQLRWWHSVSAPVLGVPVVAGNTLYISGGQSMFALDMTGGIQRWILALGDVRNDSALGQERLYVGTVEGDLFAID